MNFLNKLEQFKSKTCLVINNEEITYKNILDYSLTISKKIKEKSLVVIICENSYEIIASYIACIKTNSVIIFVDQSLSQLNFNKVITTYKPEYIFCRKKKLINLNYKLVDSFGLFNLLEAKRKEKKKINNNLSILLSTSGTTGSSKFVRISNENLNSNTNQIIESLNINSEHRSITTMPMNYTYGMSIINSHLATGASIVLNNMSFFEKDFWKLLNEKKVTNFGGVPFMYEILERIKFEDKIPKSLKYITQAGGKLTNELFKKVVLLCEKKNLSFISMYGQTEATSRMSYLPWKFAKTKIGSIGKPLKGGNFYIIDKDLNKIKEANQSGQLIYNGKNVSLGYAEKISDLNLGDLNKGKLFTGDLAFKDKEGFYYISGRLKRISKIFGLRINLDELESLINNWGYEIAITSNDEKLFCFFSKNIQKEAMIEEISKNTGIHKIAIEIKILANIPRNSSGKISYRELNIYA